MKSVHFFRRLRIVPVAVVIGVLGCVAIGFGEEKATPLPEYLKTARHITSAKCKMCHKASFANWEKTSHAKFREACPWEKTATADKPVEKPAADVVYRYVTGYDAAAGTWAEKGIGCEACHGPGSAHMTAKKEERKATIIDAANLGTAAQKASVCGRCHGQYTIGEKQYAEGFMPGQDLTAIPGIKLDAVQPGKKMQEFNELVASKHYKNGVVCTTCHTAHAEVAQPHNLRKPVVELCMECHKDKTMAEHAPKAAEGATCSTCHMAKGDHSFMKSGGE